MATHELETRVVAALTGDGITSANVEALILETASAIADGENAAAAERERAFDPVVSPDIKAAREQMQDALFKVARMKTLLPRLEKLSGEVRAAEEIAAFTIKRDALQSDGDAIETELVETYSEAARQIVDVFARASAFRDRVRQELPAVPSGVAQFRKFAPSVSRLLGDVVLVALDDGRHKLWPVKSSGAFAAEFAQAMTVPSHPGSDWGSAEVRAQRRKVVEAEQAGIARHMAEATQQQEDRLNAEARERAAAMRHTG
jgi:hypothetical protein